MMPRPPYSTRSVTLLPYTTLFLSDQREFVHQRDIEIALRVLDDLGGLGDLDRWRAVDAGVDDRAISVGNAVQCFRAIARHYLDDLAQRTFAIARIDALRRIREMEIGAVFEAGDLFQQRPADVFGDARIRSEEHTSELQSLMRISYAVFCLKKKKKK